MAEEIKGQPTRHPFNQGGKELFERLKKDGWNPQVCDAEYSYMPQDDETSAGFVAHESFEERVMLPPEIMPLFPKTGISMNDNSMTAVGISKGDILIMVGDNQADDGKLVLAYVDGKQMVRFYFEDDEGNKWLLSKNEGVEPICINDMKDAIIARILRCIRNAPSLKYNEAKQLTKDAKRSAKKPKVASLAHAQWVIRLLGPDVKVMRDWFSFYDLYIKMTVFGDLIRHADDDIQTSKRGPQNLLVLLPAEFTFDDAKLVRQKQGMSTDNRHTKKMIRNWIDRKFVTQNSELSFKKNGTGNTVK